MSLTIFLAICILGCDVLIYFLYEWAFGESKRIRKRRATRHLWADMPQEGQGHAVRESRAGAGVRIIEMDRGQGTKLVAAGVKPNPYEERLAYRRMAASFAPMKRRA